MKLSEVIKKWEDGWRGIALDGEGIENDFSSEYIDIEAYSNEDWVIKEIKKEPLNVTVNVTINQDSINEVEEIIKVLRKKLNDILIDFTIA